VITRRASRDAARPPHRGRLARLILTLGVVSLAAGCAPSNYYRSTESQLDSLLTNQGELMKRVDRLDRKLDETRGGVSASRAGTEARLRELSERLDTVVSKMEEALVRVQAMGVKVDAVRLRSAREDSIRGSQGLSSRDPNAPIDPESAYNAAYADYSAGRYPLAREAFRTYLQHYPDTEVADNAQYWIGETLYATGDFAGAITEFKLVAERYPKGDKVPAALLKAGMASARLKNNDQAKTLYRQVIQKYPKSPEATLAKERLSHLP
jgi:tol-pal system protein YbgF